MITLIQFGLLLLVVFGYAPLYLTLFIPAAYIVLMAPGAFRGGSGVGRKELASLLSQNWHESEALADYMRSYWFALRYSASATARQRTCTSLFFLSVAGSVVGFWNTNDHSSAWVSMVLAGVLWAMATRVNGPLSMFKDSRVRNSADEWSKRQWGNAVSSIVAFAELHPDDENYTFLANEILKDPLAIEVIRMARRS